VLFFRSPPVEHAEVAGPQPHVPARAPGSFEARDDAGSHAG
jgi:hypothetical protein